MQKFWNKFFFTFLVVVSSLPAFSQNNLLSDIQYIQQVKTNKDSTTHHVRSYIYSDESNPIKKWNPINMALGGVLFVYQNTLSQHFSATCLYHPSCSDFSKKSIQNYGLLKGIFLSADRVMRCNRIAATGIHPLRLRGNKVDDPVTFYKSVK